MLLCTHYAFNIDYKTNKLKEYFTCIFWRVFFGIAVVCFLRSIIIPHSGLFKLNLSLCKQYVENVWQWWILLANVVPYILCIMLKCLRLYINDYYWGIMSECPEKSKIEWQISKSLKLRLLVVHIELFIGVWFICQMVFCFGRKW